MKAPAPLRDFALHGICVVLFNCVIGFGLALRNDQPLTQLAYAQAIGLSIWLCSEFGRFFFKREPTSNWPTGWRRAALMVGSIVVGYLVGTALGDLWSGASTFAELQHSPRKPLGYLFLAVVCGLSASYFFYVQGRQLALQKMAGEAQRAASQTQLQLLASQLEPHMLFNTLANLRVLIDLDPPRAQAMLDHLVAFMRATLTASRGLLHPLSEEFARIHDYLALMQIRMGDRLQAEVTLPDALGSLAVPTLLLQPLVENAIKHGLEPTIQGGQLIISAQRIDPDLVLTVRDTGAGLAHVANDGTHFGVNQVRERLATLYGDSAQLHLQNADDGRGGVVATVRIPLNRTA